MCETCDTYDTEIAVHGPAQLRRIVAKIQDAVRSTVLRCEDADPESIFAGQTSFPDLDLGGTLPDHLDYRFRCARCGARYRLAVETYHGAGGTWSRG